MSDFHPGSVRARPLLSDLSSRYRAVESCLECSDNVRALTVNHRTPYRAPWSSSTPPPTTSGYCWARLSSSSFLLSRMRTHADATFRLTGLLSFMLSDEMTTGSVTSSDAHKRTYASRSHAWNIQQARFKEAFPEVRRLSIPLTHNQYFP